MFPASWFAPRRGPTGSVPWVAQRPSEVSSHVVTSHEPYERARGCGVDTLSPATERVELAVGKDKVERRIPASRLEKYSVPKSLNDPRLPIHRVPRPWAIRIHGAH